MIMVSEIKLPQLASQLNNGEGVGPHRERGDFLTGANGHGLVTGPTREVAGPVTSR